MAPEARPALSSLTAFMPAVVEMLYARPWPMEVTASAATTSPTPVFSSARASGTQDSATTSMPIDIGQVAPKRCSTLPASGPMTAKGIV